MAIGMRSIKWYLAAGEDWEPSNYDVESLDRAIRDRLYSERGKEILRAHEGRNSDVGAGRTLEGPTSSEVPGLHE